MSTAFLAWEKCRSHCSKVQNDNNNDNNNTYLAKGPNYHPVSRQKLKTGYITQNRHHGITKTSNKLVYIYIYIYQYVHPWVSYQSLSREWT